MTGPPDNPIAIPDHVRRQMLLESIFLPLATQRREQLYAHNPNHLKVVHYTSAEAALKIIRGKRLWMRNTRCMADYREVQHGFDIYDAFFSDQPKRKMFVEALDACVPGAASEAIELFYAWWKDDPSNLLLNTYITSVSEHDAVEDLHGRLSMWRGFGGANGRVAIVLKVPWYTGARDELKITFNPVGYLSEERVHEELFKAIANVRTNCAFLAAADRLLVIEAVFTMLAVGVTCLKHEGFHEEREWRVLYFPKRLRSPLLESSIETIGGIPQLVYQLPLDRTVSPALAELDLSRILDRIIIGPSAFPWVMYEAFVSTLSTAGVSDGENRVFVSNIPVRL